MRKNEYGKAARKRRGRKREGGKEAKMGRHEKGKWTCGYELLFLPFCSSLFFYAPLSSPLLHLVVICQIQYSMKSFSSLSVQFERSKLPIA
jgi:hypothetical protein